MASLDDLNRKLDAAGEGTQPAKFTKEGDQIAGTVKVVGSFTHAEYGTSPTLTIDTDDDSVILDGKKVPAAGTMRVLMAGAVLGGAMDEQQITSGDWIALRYLGKRQTSNGAASYNNYAVVVEHPSASSKLDSASEFV